MLRNRDTKEILSHIRQIEIKTSKIVNNIFAGQYSSVFKGQGIEFSEVREYEVGDDIRSIDWNVTAKNRKPFIKKYTEEREMTVMISVDMSKSLEFGSGEKFKVEIVAEIAAILAFSAIKNNDKVGLLIFTDEVEKFIKPKKGKQHILRIIREILYFEPKNRTTDITKSLDYLNQVLKHKSVVFLISDFLGQDYEKAIRITNKKHDLINVRIFDTREVDLPKIGFVNLKDNETGEVLEINTSNQKFANEFKKTLALEKEIFKSLCRKNALTVIDINTERSYVDPLIKFFRTRE